VLLGSFLHLALQLQLHQRKPSLKISQWKASCRKLFLGLQELWNLLSTAPDTVCQTEHESNDVQMHS